MNLWENTLYIDGKFIPLSPQQCHPVFNKKLNAIIGSVASGGLNEITQAILAAKSAIYKSSWAKDWQFRRQCYHQFRAALLKYKNEISSTYKSQMSIATVSNSSSEQTISYSWPVEGYLSVDAPFDEVSVYGISINDNEPLQALLNAIIFSINKGCTLILSVSSPSPLSATLVAKMIDKTNIPPGVINIVTVKKQAESELCFSIHDVTHVMELDKTKLEADIAVQSA